MDIPQTLIDDVVRNDVQLGDVYKIELSKADGIIPKMDTTHVINSL